MTVADTSLLIDLLQGDPGALRIRDGYAAESWILHAPDIALHELHRSLAQVRRPDRKWDDIRNVLKHCARLPFDREAAAIAGQIEGALKREGTPIDTEDCMIAGIALANGMAVLTRNTRDFGRITGLDVQTY
jgi:tRNA(fMet)-specific endonuclease VapC